MSIEVGEGWRKKGRIGACLFGNLRLVERIDRDGNNLYRKGCQICDVGLHVAQAHTSRETPPFQALTNQLHHRLNQTILGSEGFGNGRDFGQFEPLGMPTFQ
jgi:hypothetical protein